MPSKRRDSWTLENNDYETEEQFRAAVAEEMARFEHIGYRQGFGLVAAPIRQRIGDSIVTLGWQFRAERIPLVQGDPQQAEPLPDAPEPEDEELQEEMDELREERRAAAEETLTDDEPEPRETATVASADPYAEDS